MDKVVHVRATSGGDYHWVMNRDVEAHRYLLENRCATPADFARNFFQTTDSHVHYRRLAIYVRRGTMKKVRKDENGADLYQLTRDGLRLLNDFGISTRGYRGVEGLYRSSLGHDAIMRRVREIFLQSPIISNYLAEQKVRSILAIRHGGQQKRDEFYKVPDAIFTLRQAHKHLTIAVELEIALKSKKRYLKMMQQLCLSTDFDNIFFIAHDENILNRLRSHLRDVRENSLRVRHHDHEHGFYFVLLSELERNRLNAKFASDDGSFTLKSLEPKTLLTQLT